MAGGFSVSGRWLRLILYFTSWGRNEEKCCSRWPHQGALRKARLFLPAASPSVQCPPCLRSMFVDGGAGGGRVPGQEQDCSSCVPDWSLRPPAT